MMASEKKVEQITDPDIDFAKWYTDVCVKAELVDYSGVKGFFIIRPYGFALWENIQARLDSRFKELGHMNVSMPLLIPESLLQKEKDHVEGFSPECAWVTFGGEEELEERLCIRPTSETLFCDHWANVVHSWRDLPMLYNQWCSVLRWEKTTRPFLRHREFQWQEGHTLHATAEEAIEETRQQLEVYADLCENTLAMPVIRGSKTDNEKFAGAERTYTIECMMRDGKALQSGTSHYFGDGFAKAFDITFSDKNNIKCYPHQTSWGLSTRIIGGIIMTHGDADGLVIPPRIAPVQAVVVPVALHKEGVAEKANELISRLTAAGLRVKGDFSDNSPGRKFAEHEMKGIPLRLEIGPKDIENNSCLTVRRDNGEKRASELDGIETSIPKLLDEVQTALFEKAKKNLEEHSCTAETPEEISMTVKRGGGFITTAWCGDTKCELSMKEKYGFTARCIPFTAERPRTSCPLCGKPGKTQIVWGVAY